MKGDIEDIGSQESDIEDEDESQQSRQISQDQIDFAQKNRLNHDKQIHKESSIKFDDGSFMEKKMEIEYNLPQYMNPPESLPIQNNKVEEPEQPKPDINHNSSGSAKKGSILDDPANYEEIFFGKEEINDDEKVNQIIIPEYEENKASNNSEPPEIEQVQIPKNEEPQKPMDDPYQYDIFLENPPLKQPENFPQKEEPKKDAIDSDAFVKKLQEEEDEKMAAAYQMYYDQQERREGSHSHSHSHSHLRQNHRNHHSHQNDQKSNEIQGIVNEENHRVPFNRNTTNENQRVVPIQQSKPKSNGGLCFCCFGGKAKNKKNLPKVNGKKPQQKNQGNFHNEYGE